MALRVSAGVGVVVRGGLRGAESSMQSSVHHLEQAGPEQLRLQLNKFWCVREDSNLQGNSCEYLIYSQVRPTVSASHAK